MKPFGTVLLLIGTVVVGVPVGRMYAQINRSEVAQQILSDDAELRNIALSKVRTAGPEKADSGVRAAMFTALLRQANVHAQRYYAGRRGEVLADLGDPEFVAQLSIAVVELHDPQAIPALSAAMFSGPLVSLELANFGEPAAARVLQVVTAPDGWYEAVDGGLISLRFMIEQKGEHPLSLATIAQIRRAAAQRLNGKQYFTTLWRAMDLAAVLGDADLTHLLELLASDSKEMFARGIEDPDLVELTRKRAADRLAGIPPLPRRSDVMTVQR
jgi:hypothetical protein